MQKLSKILWNKSIPTLSFSMFTRLIGFVIIIATLYMMLIFIAPNFTDTYWNKSINTNIRNIKNKSLQFASGSDSASSLYDKIKNTSKFYLDDARNTIQWIQTTVDNKVIQVNDASIAVEKAYTGVVDAANKIQKLTGTGQ